MLILSIYFYYIIIFSSRSRLCVPTIDRQYRTFFGAYISDHTGNSNNIILYAILFHHDNIDITKIKTKQEEKTRPCRLIASIACMQYNNIRTKKINFRSLSIYRYDMNIAFHLLIKSIIFKPNGYSPLLNVHNLALCCIWSRTSRTRIKLHNSDAEPGNCAECNYPETMRTTKHPLCVMWVKWVGGLHILSAYIDHRNVRHSMFLFSHSILVNRLSIRT